MNLLKKELYSIHTDGAPFAATFQCNIGHFPFKYLGLPLHNQKLSMDEWQFLVDKIENRLQNWKGQLLSIGGRLALLNAVLSAIPLYTLSVYRAPKTILRRINSIRNRFLWHGSDRSKHKYTLVNWDRVCSDKQHGGWGVLNLQYMNLSLLLKWWWKYHDPTYEGLWKSVILYKDDHHLPISPFWKDILKLENIGKISVTFTPGAHSNISFWHTIWNGTCSLVSQFPQLYKICSTPHINVTTVINSQGSALQFTRTLSGVLLSEWQHLLALISSCSFTHTVDKIAWRWELTGKFSVQSIYHILNFSGISRNRYVLLWALPLPPKIRIFMWLVMHNRILTKNNLYKKGWRGDLTCQFCHKKETISHLFLKCPVARQIWFWFGNSQHHFSNWKTIADIFNFSGSLSKNQQIAFLVVFSAICWTLWKHRNALIFQDAKIHTIRSIILLIISLFEYWAGNIPKKIKQMAADWMPIDIDAIPIRTWMPADADPTHTGNQMVLYQGDDGGAMVDTEGGAAGCPTS